MEDLVTYNGFLSYSHSEDQRLAPAIQTGLQQLAKPWHRRRALWIFRDQTGLSVAPGLWSTISEAMDDSEYFILLASPQAAQSGWVSREIERWLSSKSVDRILPVVTAGLWQWDEAAGDFTADSTAVPAALRGVFSEEPLHLDLRWAKRESNLTLDHHRFRDAVAQLAAPMHGISREELVGEDLRQHRKVRRARSGAVAVLVTTTVLAVAAGLFAAHKGDQAVLATAEAQRQEKHAAVQREAAHRYGLQAQRQQQIAAEQRAAAVTARSEAEEQRAAAREQQAVARESEAEASRMRAEVARQQTAADAAVARANRLKLEAEGAAAEARRQQRLAGVQQKLAVRQSEIAVARRLNGQARDLLSADPATALRLGVAARALARDERSRLDLTNLVNSTGYLGEIGRFKTVSIGPRGISAGVDADGNAIVFALSGRSGIKVLARLPRSAATGLVFSHNGRLLAVTSNDDGSLWDIKDPTRPKEITHRKAMKWGGMAAFSADDQMMIVCEYVGAGHTHAILWDMSNPLAPEILSKFQDTLAAPTFSVDGQRLIVTPLVDSAPFEVWDISDPRAPVLRGEIPKSSREQESVFSLRAGIVLTSSSFQVSAWDVSRAASPRKLSTSPLDGKGIGVNRAKNTFYSVGESGLEAWEYTVMEAPRHYRTRAFVSSRDGDVGLGLDGRTVAYIGLDSRVRLSRVDEPGADQAPSSSFFGGTNAPGGMPAATYAQHGRLATTLWGGALQSWDLEHNISPARFGPAVDTEIAAFEGSIFSDDGSTLVRLGPKVFAVWRQNGKKWARSKVDSGGWYPAVSPDGKLLAFMGWNSKTELWSLANPTAPRRLAVFGEAASNLGFSADGKMLVINSRLWNIARPDHPQQISSLDADGEIPSYDFQPYFAAFAPVLVLKGRLWDISNPRKPQLGGAIDGMVIRGSLSRNPKGDPFIWTDDFGKRKVWNIKDVSRPVQVASFAAEGGHLLAVDPDGHSVLRYMTTRSDDAFVSSSMSEWSSLAQNPSAYACGVVGRDLSPSEWQKYVPESPRRVACN